MKLKSHHKQEPFSTPIMCLYSINYQIKHFFSNTIATNAPKETLIAKLSLQNLYVLPFFRFAPLFQEESSLEKLSLPRFRKSKVFRRSGAGKCFSTNVWKTPLSKRSAQN